MADQNIKTLFAEAQRKKQEVDQAYDRQSTAYHDNLSDAIEIFEECRVLADRLSVFSSNETVDDIATGDLPYLLINFNLGELYTHVSTGARHKSLEKARLAYERYLSTLHDYEILLGTSLKQYEIYYESPTTYSTISTSDFTQRRAQKIANFKLEKELKQKIDFLAQNPRYLSNDEGAVRDITLARLELHTHHTFQALETINLELQVLASKPPTPPAGPESLARDHRERTQRGEKAAQDYTDRMDRPISEILAENNRPGPLLDKKGKPLKIFTLTGDSRRDVKKGVFKSGHNLPTMTIDEYLEEERKRGGIIEGGGEASGIIAELDEDDHEAMDAATYKARNWDEFTEANPKGAGNTLNRG